jgi:hypothetical protein
MNGKLVFAAGLAVGFVLGARQGRGAYDKLTARVQRTWNDPAVQRRVSDAQDVIREKVPVVGEKVSDAIDAAKSKTSGDAGE